MNLNQMARIVVGKEGGKKRVDIAQTKEVMRIVLKILIASENCSHESTKQLRKSLKSFAKRYKSEIASISRKIEKGHYV